MFNRHLDTRVAHRIKHQTPSSSAAVHDLCCIGPQVSIPALWEKHPDPRLLRSGVLQWEMHVLVPKLSAYNLGERRAVDDTP